MQKLTLESYTLSGLWVVGVMTIVPFVLGASVKGSGVLGAVLSGIPEHYRVGLDNLGMWCLASGSHVYSSICRLMHGDVMCRGLCSCYPLHSIKVAISLIN